MNVEIKTESAQFPEKEYIKGIFLAVYVWTVQCTVLLLSEKRSPAFVILHPV